MVIKFNIKQTAFQDMKLYNLQIKAQNVRINLSVIAIINSNRKERKYELGKQHTKCNQLY